MGHTQKFIGITDMYNTYEIKLLEFTQKIDKLSRWSISFDKNNTIKSMNNLLSVITNNAVEGSHCSTWAGFFLNHNVYYELQINIARNFP